MSSPLDQEDLAQVVEQVRSGCYEVLFMEAGDSYLSGHSELADRALEQANMHPRLEEAEYALGRDVYQLNVFLSDGEMDTIRSAVSKMAFTRWSENFADAMPIGGGKGAGVAAALAWAGVDPDEAVAFGDGENDAEMFAAVGTSVAMSGASQAVRELCDYVTEDVDDDGIWKACQRLGVVRATD